MEIQDDRYVDSDYYEDSDEDIDHNNYKGIYFEDEPGQKYQDPVTGAHFEHEMMVELLH